MRELLLKTVLLFKNVFSSNKFDKKIMKTDKKSDPNGLCMAEKIEAQICGIKMAIKNTEDGIKINHIGIQSLHNGIPIFDPSRNPNIDNIDYTLKLQIGAGAKETIMIKIDPMNISIIGLADASLITQEGARIAIDGVLKAIDIISNRRIIISTTQSKLKDIIEHQTIMIENLSNTTSLNRDISMTKINNKYSYNVIPLMKDKKAN
ncbi:MAG: hypothetical protein E7F68_20045 [Clostridium butyricum]|nr:hypothetical protein [Clostridium butyricum]